jgi:hypothetical protein
MKYGVEMGSGAMIHKADGGYTYIQQGDLKSLFYF